MGKLTAFAVGAPALILLILGLTPHQTMDRLAGEGMLLPGLHASKHAVQYLSLGNLKGARFPSELAMFCMRLLSVSA